MTRFQRWLRSKGIDKFEYEKIVPNAEAWKKLMDEWHEVNK